MPRRWKPSDGPDAIQSHLRQPSAADCRRMLAEVKKRLRWSNQRFANYLGVAECTLSFWVQGRRSPASGCRRLIWWFWSSICAPQHLQTPYAFLLWGGVQESEGLAKARRVAAAQAKGKFSPCCPHPQDKSGRFISKPGATAEG